MQSTLETRHSRILWQHRMSSEEIPPHLHVDSDTKLCTQVGGDSVHQGVYLTGREVSGGYLPRQGGMSGGYLIYLTGRG